MVIPTIAITTIPPLQLPIRPNDFPSITMTISIDTLRSNNSNTNVRITVQPKITTSTHFHRQPPTSRHDDYTCQHPSPATIRNDYNYDTQPFNQTPTTQLRLRTRATTSSNHVTFTSNDNFQDQRNQHHHEAAATTAANSNRSIDTD